MTSGRRQRQSKSPMWKLLGEWHPEPMKAKDGETVLPNKLVAVLGAIIDCQPLGGECYANQQTLARKAKCGERTVRRAVGCLIALGILRRSRRSRGGRQAPNHVHVELERLAELVQLASSEQPVVAPETTGRDDREQPVVAAGTTGRDDRNNRSWRPEQPVVAAGTTGRGDQNNRSWRPEQPVVTTGTTGRGGRQTTKGTIKELQTTTTTREPLRGEWEQLRVELYQDGRGMVQAAAALHAAFDRGLTTEVVRGYWLLAFVKPANTTRPPGFGGLCNWLTGRGETAPPTAEALAAFQRGEQAAKAKAKAIRTDKQRKASHCNPPPADWIVSGKIGAALRGEGLQRFATAEELHLANELDRIDAERAAGKPLETDGEVPLGDLLASASRKSKQRNARTAAEHGGRKSELFAAETQI